MFGPYLAPLLIFVLFAVGGLAILRRFPPALLLAGPTYAIVTRVASLGFLESEETYLIETRLTSTDIGATERALVYNLLILFVALAVLKSLSSAVLRRYRLTPERVASIATGRQTQVSILLAGTLLGFQFVNALLSHPYPLPGSGVSRQEFAQGLRSPEIVAVVGELAIFAPIVGATAVALGVLSQKRSLRIRGSQLTVLHCAYLLLMGQRVNGGILVGGIWLATFVSVLWLGGQRLSLGRLSRWLLPIALAIMALGQADVAGRNFAQEFDSPLGAVTYRAFALQGGVAYTAEYRASRGERVEPKLILEGMSTTLDVYLPPNHAEAYKRRGVNLAGSLHGNSILVFGYFWSLVPLIVYGLALGLASTMLPLAVARGKLLALFPLGFLMLRVISVNARGTFESLLNLQTLAVVIAGMIVLKVKLLNEREFYSVDEREAGFESSVTGPVCHQGVHIPTAPDKSPEPRAASL